MMNTYDKKQLYLRLPDVTRQKKIYGLKIWGTFFLTLCLYLIFFESSLNAASGTFSPVSGTADLNANTATPVFVMADDLSYDNQTSEIFGYGHGTIKHDNVYIFADKIYANVTTGDVNAEGNVLVMENDQRIYTDRIYYNFKTITAYSKDVTILQPPWIVKGKKMMTEGKKTEIESPVFTTCDKEEPHYRMESSIIYIYQDDKIEGWNTIFYLGRIPVIYFPYFYIPLKNHNNKMPFEIQVGHNDVQGYYVNGLYNYFFDQRNQGTVEVDWMEKLGWAYRDTSNYGFSKDSTGSIYAYYTRTKTQLNGQDEHWEADFNHTQQFNDTTKLNLKASHVSDSLLSDETLGGEVDNYSQNSYADFTTSFWGNQSLDINASDTETLVTTDQYGNPLPKTQYYYKPSARTLPYLNYQMMSKEILPRLYLTNSLNFTRSLISGDLGSYDDNATMNPNLTISLPRLLIMSLSGGGGFRANWSNSDEKKDIKGEFLNTYTENSNLVVDLAPRGMVQVALAQNFARQINKNINMIHEGITTDSLNFSATGNFGALTLRSNTTYDMLSDWTQVRNYKDRFSLLNTTASMYFNEYSFYANSGYSIFAAMIKNIDLSFAMGDRDKSLWSMNMATTYVNNLIDSRGYPQQNIKDTLYFTTGFNFAFTEEFTVGVQRRYDLINKQLLDHSYSLIWHLHCWDASFSWSKRQDNVEEVNFSVNISALPQYKLTKPATIAPSINPQLGTQ